MERRRDNFGVLRLGAAVAVLVSHAFGLTGRVDPLRALTGQDLGGVAVAVFFAISGYLVAGSWRRDPQLGRFLGRRVTRIWPGLTVAVLFTAYVVGPLFTRLSLADYVGGGGASGWVLAKLAMLPADRLPGVFSANPLTTANGSLWTLPLEVKAYLLLALLGLAGALRGRRLLWVAWLACTAAAVLVTAVDVSSVVSLWPQDTFLLAVFLGGALLERERVPLRGRAVAALVAIWVASRGTPIQPAVGAAAFPYACVWLAYRTRPVLVGLVERADLSYGIYLYAYPVEQAVRAVLGRAATPAATAALALPVSVGLALGSWRFVERPWLTRRRSPVPTADPAQALALR